MPLIASNKLNYFFYLGSENINTRDPESIFGEAILFEGFQMEARCEIARM